MKRKAAAPRKTPLANAVEAAVAPAAPEAGAAAPTMQPVDAFNFIAQYVMEKVAKEDPSVRMVMDQQLKMCFNTLRTCLGG